MAIAFLLGVYGYIVLCLAIVWTARTDKNTKFWRDVIRGGK